MRYDSFRHHRRSIRLMGYDYSSEGAYFVTICTKDRERLFGEVIDRKMQTNECGIIVRAVWEDLAKHFSGVELDESIIMPNHIHGIIWNVGAGFPRPQGGSTIQGAETAPLRKITLGQIVAYLKYRSSKMINELQKMPGQPIWQRNYYERIIRNDAELNRIRQYIQDNPENWENDPENI